MLHTSSTKTNIVLLHIEIFKNSPWKIAAYITWEVAPWELASLGNCTLGTSLLGNWPPWEVALGKFLLGNIPWENVP